MAKRSIIKKLSKEQKSLLIGLLLGDGTISSNCVLKFRPFKEGRGTYSIATSSELDCDKFVNIVRPYIEQVPSLLYKIRRDSTKLEFIAQQRAASEARDTLELE